MSGKQKQSEDLSSRTNSPSFHDTGWEELEEEIEDDEEYFEEDEDPLEMGVCPVCGGESFDSAMHEDCAKDYYGV